MNVFPGSIRICSRPQWSADVLAASNGVRVVNTVTDVSHARVFRMFEGAVSDSFRKRRHQHKVEADTALGVKSVKTSGAAGRRTAEALLTVPSLALDDGGAGRVRDVP